jgi:hypothetical protein
MVNYLLVSHYCKFLFKKNSRSEYFSTNLFLPLYEVVSVFYSSILLGVASNYIYFPISCFIDGESSFISLKGVVLLDGVIPSDYILANS